MSEGNHISDRQQKAEEISFSRSALVGGLTYQLKRKIVLQPLTPQLKQKQLSLLILTLQGLIWLLPQPARPLQAHCKYPERLIVGHPFNLSYLLPLVEVVGGRNTSVETIDWSMAIYRHWGKALYTADQNPQAILLTVYRMCSVVSLVILTAPIFKIRG